MIPLQGPARNRTRIGNVRVRRIGAGDAATAYRGEDGRVYLLTDDKLNDGARDLYARLRRRGNRHVPAVEYLGRVPHGKAYRMPLYRTAKTYRDLTGGLNRGAVQELRLLLEAERAVLGRSLYRHASIPAIYAALRRLAPRAAVTQTLRAFAAFGRGPRWVFDIAARNLAADGKGNLILLDVLLNRDVFWDSRGRSVRRHNPPGKNPEAYAEDEGLEYTLVDRPEHWAALERVVWAPERPTVLYANDLPDCGLPGEPGLFGLHVTSEPEYWAWRLEQDYGRPSEEAWLVEVFVHAGEAVTPDPCQMEAAPGDDDAGDAPYSFDYTDSSSAVLVTPREELLEGRDFRVVGRFDPTTRRFK